MEKASRMQALAPAIFSEMDLLGKQVSAQGVDVINLSIGSPDQPPAEHIRRALIDAVSDSANYGYTLSGGIDEFKEAVAHWYWQRFRVILDPAREVLPLMGSQDGLTHIFLAYVNPGEVALIPDPGYPAYSAGLALAGGRKFPLSLKEENSFLPKWGDIPPEVAREAKIMFLNYPSNPLAAVATREFFDEVVAFAAEYDILVCHDIAYSELAFDDYRPPSFLEAQGAKEVGVEFHSLSKSFNMAGCRLGFVVGNPEVIATLGQLKSNIDYGVFKAVQLTGIAALTGPQDWVRETASVYARRRDVLVDGLVGLGWKMKKPRASMFVWAPLPEGYHSSREFAVELLERAGVLVVPGTGFGEQGEGYVRIALVCSEMRLAEAVRRIGDQFHFKTK
ncbi:MAG: LL-diaminopimelate aminotransferase [Bacillota bacterium]